MNPIPTTNYALFVISRIQTISPNATIVSSIRKTTESDVSTAAYLTSAEKGTV